MAPDRFSVEGLDALSAIADLLITIGARQRALEEFILHNHSEKTGEDFKALADHFDETIHFHRGHLVKSLYEKFASLNEILNKKEGD
jgi:hypothetical protein